MASFPKAIHQKLHQKLLRNTLGRTQRVNLVRSVCGFLPNRKMMALDIGCGNGLFARDLMAARPRLQVVGVETKTRPDCQIEYCVYDGKHLPFADKQFDYVLLINVLHHTDDPACVLAEAARVATQGIVIKDHYANNRLDFYTLVMMERIGNAFVDISQPYNFFSEKQWRDLFERVGLQTESIHNDFVSYNAFVDLLFGRNLHFIAKVACPVVSNLSSLALDGVALRPRPSDASAA